ncbi:alpha/beta fold hydrolase [Patescibacteria group bacterium]|nr:alpha/beta fold hydrolase [Patescibacteria group bacterium]
MPTVTVNDIAIYYELLGQGEPLVFIGGLAIDLSDYSGVIKALAEDYRVLAFDNRGAGRTDKPNMPYSIELMADDTAKLMAAVGITRANIIGLSMGGRIALHLALAHPELVKKLILVSTSARVDKKRSWLVGLLGILSSLPILPRGKYPQPRYAFLRQRQASRAYDCTTRLAELKMPVMIMHGRRDIIAPYALALEMRDKIPGAKITPFAGGHLFSLMGEQKEFIEAVKKFVRD